MNHRELETGTEENREVTELLAALPRVEAPANFEFGVKARIAAGGSRRRSTMFPFLKIAVPLGLVLLVVGLVIFYGSLPGSNVPDIAVQQNYTAESPVVAKVPEQEPSGPSVAESRAVEPRGGEVAAVPTERQQKRAAVRRSTGSASRSEPGGGSFDTSLSDANVFQAPGTRMVKNPEIPVRELLDMLGMKVDLVGGKWMVTSTSANSVAERSGVLANDIVESINDQAIGGSAKFRGTGSKTITVGRAGKSIKLALKH